MAWDDGVPGLLDLSETSSGTGWEVGGIQSTCVVSLGSEGARSWFLVADSLTPRPPLEAQVKGRLMFIAGELASILFHQDLDPDSSRGCEVSDSIVTSSDGAAPFAGWDVLADMEGRERDGDAGRRITNRFLLVRALRGALDDDLVVDHDSLAYQIEGIRREMGHQGSDDPEREHWERVLSLLESSDHETLQWALLDWGKVVESQGHQRGSLEIQSLAYDLAVATGSPECALEAARFQGKGHRMEADWDEAVAWYGTARRIAEEVGDTRKLAAVMDGLANTYRDRGNLPRARELLGEVMALGEEGNDRYAVAIAHHDLMTVERLSENMVRAVQHGWSAVQSYDSRDGSLKALFDLAGVLRETGELSAARDAYTIVADQLPQFEHRMMALDALAYIAALEGDRPRYHELRAEMEEGSWQELSPVFRGQVLFYRGLSSRALGQEEEGEARLTEALDFAERHSLNWLIFDIEEALEERADGGRTSHPAPGVPVESPGPGGAELVGVRQGLRELREALVPPV
jgi:tetratricopeptide (TPR) repeat protein